MSRLGMSIGLTAGALAMYLPLASLVKSAFRHPVISAIVIGIASLIILADDVFNFTTVDARAMMNMSEIEIAQTHETQYCEHDGYVICEYDDMRISYIDGYPASISFDARSFLFRDYENSEEFYRYVLERSGFSYQEPVYADMNMIIWHDIDGVSRLVLTSSDYMAPKKLVVER